MGFIKKALKWGFIGYSAAYIGLGGYAFYDYNNYNIERIERKAKNTLEIRDYDVTLDNKIKKLTILGEIHMYNHKESSFVKDFVDNYEHIAVEGSGGVDADKLMLMTAIVSLPSFIFYTMGSGRDGRNRTTHDWAMYKGKDVSYLEDGKDNFQNNATLNQRITLLVSSVPSLMAAPLLYYIGKDELINGEKQDLKKDERNIVYYAANVEKRDTIMVENIIEIMEMEHVDKLLCVVGKAHVLGMEKKLAERVKLERIKK